MFELAAVVVVSAVALSFFADAMSRTVNLVRSPGRSRRSGAIRVADPDLSA
jgi:hypothetical protein